MRTSGPCWSGTLVSGRLFRSQPGIRPNLQLGEFVLGVGIDATHHRAEKRAEETDRNAQDARVLEGEDGTSLDEVLAVRPHDARADDDQDEGTEQPHGESADRALGGEALPKDR